MVENIKTPTSLETATETHEALTDTIAGILNKGISDGTIDSSQIKDPTLARKVAETAEEVRRNSPLGKAQALFNDIQNTIEEHKASRPKTALEKAEELYQTTMQTVKTHIAARRETNPTPLEKAEDLQNSLLETIEAHKQSAANAPNIVKEFASQRQNVLNTSSSAADQVLETIAKIKAQRNTP